MPVDEVAIRYRVREGGRSAGDAVRGRSGHRRDAARDGVREPVGGGDPRGVGSPRQRRGRARLDDARSRARGRRCERRVGWPPSVCAAAIAVGPGRRDRDGEPDGGARLDVGGASGRSVDGCRGELRRAARRRARTWRRARSAASKPPASTRVDAAADAVACLEHDDLEARVDELARRGESGEARADHGDAFTRLGDAGDARRGAQPRGARALERARSHRGRMASPAKNTRSATGSASASRSSGVAPDGVEAERAARERVGAPA